MSKEEHFICSNCGAENSHYGKCDSCGGIIKSTHGNIIPIDERVLVQEDLKCYPTIYPQTYCKYSHYREGFIKYLKGKYKDKNGTYSSSIRIHFFFRQPKEEKGYCDFGAFEFTTINVDGFEFKFDFEHRKMNIGVLSTICSAKHVAINGEFRSHLSCKIEVDEKSVWVFVTLAQVYYHTFVNSSMYADAADKLYAYFEERRKEEKEKQKKEQEELRKRKQEEKLKREQEEIRKREEQEKKQKRMKGCLILSLIIIVPLILIWLIQLFR